MLKTFTHVERIWEGNRIIKGEKMVELNIYKLKKLIDRLDQNLTELKQYIGEEQLKQSTNSVKKLINKLK